MKYYYQITTGTIVCTEQELLFDKKNAFDSIDLHTGDGEIGITPIVGTITVDTSTGISYEANNIHFKSSDIVLSWAV